MIKTRQIRRIFAELMELGLGQATIAALNRFTPPSIQMDKTVLEITNGRCGLEIGGPSQIFQSANILPIYNGAARIDNVNFSTQTAWERGLRESAPFRFNDKIKPGAQLIREAANLTGVLDRTYDFVISSHCLEHVADPISTVMEWARVTKRGGHLLIVVPNPQYTFDHRRPITSIEHLIDDHRRKVGENDLTHLPEILSLHDFNRDPGVASPAAFQARSLQNAENRCLHHHVFDLSLLKATLVAAGGVILAAEHVRPIHLVALAQFK